jgi:uncharacterized protein YbjT (DUF2867 family)
MFLVTGATGNVGGELVRALAGAGAQVRALSRQGKPAALPSSVQIVTGDLNHPGTLTGALAGVDGVFLLSGYDDMPGLLTVASQAGVTRVVLLSGGGARSTDTANVVSAYQLSSESAVRDSGLAWTILRPAGFMSNALRWAAQIQAGDTVREPFADVRVAVIDPADIAAVAAAALTTDEHPGRTYALSGPESLLPAERVHILGRVLGRDLRLEPQPDDEARKQMSGEMPAGYVDAFFSFYVDGTLDESQVEPTVGQILGRPPRSFEQWARAHANAFRPADQPAAPG